MRPIFDTAGSAHNRFSCPPRPSRCLPSAPDEAERVSCGVREDAPTPLRITIVEQRGTQIEDVCLSLIQVLDLQVDAELLRQDEIPPTRWLIVPHPLESQHEATLGVERHPAVVERPPRIRLVHLAAEKRLVEPGQLNDIGAIQHPTLQLGDHAGQRRAAPGTGLRRT